MIMYQCPPCTGTYIAYSRHMKGSVEVFTRDRLNLKGSPCTLAGSPADQFYELDPLLRHIRKSGTHPLTRAPITIQDIRPILTRTTPFFAYRRTLVKLCQRGWLHDNVVRADVAQTRSIVSRAPQMKTRFVYKEDITRLLRVMNEHYDHSPPITPKTPSSYGSDMEEEEEYEISDTEIEVTDRVLLRIWNAYVDDAELQPALARQQLDIEIANHFYPVDGTSAMITIDPYVPSVIKAEIVHFLAIREVLTKYIEQCHMNREDFITDLRAFLLTRRPSMEIPNYTTLLHMIEIGAPQICPYNRNFEGPPWIWFFCTEDQLPEFIRYKILPRVTPEEHARFSGSPQHISAYVELIRNIIERAFPIFGYFTDEQLLSAVDSVAYATLIRSPNDPHLLTLPPLPTPLLHQPDVDPALLGPQMAPRLDPLGSDIPPPIDFYRYDAQVRADEIVTNNETPIYAALERLRLLPAVYARLAQQQP